MHAKTRSIEQAAQPTMRYNAPVFAFQSFPPEQSESKIDTKENEVNTMEKSNYVRENIMNRLPCLAYASNPSGLQNVIGLQTACRRFEKVVVCEDAIKTKFRRRPESSWPLRGNSLGHTLAHRLVPSRQEE
jgi:hypothetical protein